LSITHHTRKRPSTGPRTTHGPHSSRHRAGGRTPIVAPTSSEDRSDRAQASAAHERLSRWAPYGSGSTAGQLGQWEPPDVSSSPQSCRAPPPAAVATTTLHHLGATKTRTTPICCSCQPWRWRHRRSTTARATDPRRRKRPAPRLPPLVAVIVAIALGDLAFLMLHLTRSTPLLRRSLVLVEDCLLRGRHLGRDEVGAFQLPQQECTKGQIREALPTTKGE
jgi:hypothetical protein